MDRIKTFVARYGFLMLTLAVALAKAPKPQISWW